MYQLARLRPQRKREKGKGTQNRKPFTIFNGFIYVRTRSAMKNATNARKTKKHRTRL